MKVRLAMVVILPVLLAAGAFADELGSTELQKCKICHSFDASGTNRVGPDLHSVFGHKAGTVSGFTYSDAMKASGIIWDDESLAKFLRDPKDSLPGNRMSFPGIKDETALRDLLQRNTTV